MYGAHLPLTGLSFMVYLIVGAFAFVGGLLLRIFGKK